MYSVIVGCSEVGYHLTKALLASGHEVVGSSDPRSTAVPGVMR